MWTQCSAVVLLTVQPSRGIILWGQTGLETSHLETLPSVDRQNAELATQFPIGYGGLQQEVFLYSKTVQYQAAQYVPRKEGIKFVCIRWIPPRHSVDGRLYIGGMSLSIQRLGYELDGTGFESRQGGERFYLLQNTQTSGGAQQSSCFMATWFLTGDKSAVIWCWFNAEVQKEWRYASTPPVWINSVDWEDVIFSFLASISSAVLMVQHRSATKCSSLSLDRQILTLCLSFTHTGRYTLICF
jgi:hypothetical protein